MAAWVRWTRVVMILVVFVEDPTKRLFVQILMEVHGRDLHKKRWILSYLWSKPQVGVWFVEIVMTL